MLHCRCPKTLHQRFVLSHLSASAAPRQARPLPGPHHRLEGLQSHLSPSSSSKHRKISVLKLHVRSYRRGKRPLLTKPLSKLICAFPPTLTPSEAPDVCVQVVGPGCPLWHRGQGTLSHLHYVFGVPLEWQQETCFLDRPLYPSEGNSSRPAVPPRAQMDFRLQPNQPQHFCYKLPQVLLDQLEKGGVNLPWPWHRHPSAGLYTRQLHRLRAQRDFQHGLMQLTCSFSGCATVAPLRNENGRKIINSGVS